MPRLASPRSTLSAICLITTGLIAFLHFTEQRYDRAEEGARDWLTTNGAARLSRQNVRLAFLGIDDASRNLDTLFAEDLENSRALQLMKQGFPWNREVYAHMLDRLVAAGATMVVFDMLFPVPRDGDDVFRAALERHAGRVVIGSNLKHIVEDADSAQTTVSGKHAYILPTKTLVPSGKWNDPLIGFVNVKVDEDKICRRFIYRTTLLEFFDTSSGPEDVEILSLSAQAVIKAGLGDRVPRSRTPQRMRFSEDILPRSLHEIFVESQWKAPPYLDGQYFRDKIVVIGAAGNEAEDRLQTPHGTVLAPMIHLSAINAALNRDFVHETGHVTNGALIVGAGILSWALGAFIRRPMARLGVLTASVLGFYGLAQWIYNDFGYLPILLSPILTLTLSGVTWSAWEQVLDRFERQRTRRALERYVGQDVAREVLDNPTSYLNTLSGTRKEITVLFSDVRGFTTLSETADPHALVKQLNEYFEEMVSIVFAHQGTLDKFIGDAVMAHWGSIVSEGPETDAYRAVSTVLQMRKGLARLNAGWRARGIQQMQVGFGVNQGDAIVGNLGCEAKMEVSVIGDAVNLGSRLEGVTKQYHIDLCIGENVAALVRHSFILRSVDLIVVKGKTKPVEVFTVLDKRLPDVPEPAWLARHEEAVRLYRAGDFAKAEAAWRDVLATLPGDALSEVFIARCLELQHEPPTDPWTGVYEMKSK